MNPKKYISPRRKKHRTKKVWSFSAMVLALFVAVIAGVLLERYVAYHGPNYSRTIIPNETGQAQNRQLILSSIEQMSQQLAEVQIAYQAVEQSNQRLYTLLGLERVPQRHASLFSLDKKETSDQELSSAQTTGAFSPEQTADELSPDQAMDVLSSDNTISAQELRKQLDYLLQTLHQTRDDLKVMEFILQLQSAELSQLPTSMPVRMTQARISSRFGMRKHPVKGTYRLHSGLDFAAPIGTPIYAPSAGVVSFVGYKNGYGETLEIDHGNGIMTRYAHTSKILVKEGDLILRKQLLARIGNTGQSTGAHLHFETWVNDVAVDPLSFLGRDFSVANPDRYVLLERLGLRERYFLDTRVE